MTSVSKALPRPSLRGAAIERPARRESDVRRVARLLRRYLAGQHRPLALALLMLVAEAITAIFAAYPLSYLVDYLKGDRPDLVRLLALPALVSPRAGTVALLTIAIVLMAVVNSAADSMAEIYLARVGRMLGFKLRVGVYDHLQRLSLAFFNRQRTGDVLTRVTGDVTAIEDFVISSLSDVVGSLLVLAGTLAYLLYRSWEVALVAALMVPAVVVVSDYFARRIKSAAKRQRAREGDLASAAQEMLTSIGVIQTYGRADSELRRFAACNRKTMDVALEAARIQAVFSAVIKVLEALSTIAIVWLGLWLMDRSAITLGTLLLFVILIERMFRPTRKIVKEWNRLGKMYASVERIGELLERQPEVRDEPGALPAPRLQGHVEYRHVFFAYQADDPARAHLALRDVCLDVAPGQVLALVGPSGAGKTTIGQMLPRLYDPRAGQILVDGRDIRSFTLKSLRSQVSMVLQETVLFNGTVAANIAYGCDGATQEEIVAAAVQSNAHEFIERLPRKYETELGERAASLSGGQRQRIAIARALIRRTPILILDEPTAGLDAESADLVRAALRTLMEGRTTIIISHDMNLIRDADRIAVVREGVIERVGSHRSLLEGGGVYADLYRRQFGSVFEERTAGVHPAIAPPARPDALAPPTATAPRAPQGAALPARRTNGLPLDEAEVDPWRSPVLRQELPGVPLAFDGEAMSSHLKAALFNGSAGRFDVTRCQAAEAGLLPDGTCLVRYRLDVQERAGGPRFSSLVTARLFRDPRECAAYVRDELMPLAVRMRGREDLAPFAEPAAAIDALSIALHAYPIDGELPTLLDATDGERMATTLSSTLPDPLGRAFAVGRCRVELVDYARHSRAVLRYRAEGRVADPAPEEHKVFGKVFGDGLGDDIVALVSDVTAALRERVGKGRAAPRILIPRTFAWRPDLRLLVQEAIPGAATLSGLLKAGRRGGSSRSLQDAIETCGRIAALLHTSGVRLGSRRTIEDELRSLRQGLVPILRISPSLGAWLEERVAALESCALRCRPLPLRLSHGDFTRGQVLFGGTTAGLVDFDSVCQAEPALDLGRFRTYLRIAVDGPGGSGPSIEAILARFMEAYTAAAGQRPEDREALPVRVSIYEAVSMIRRAIQCWTKFKGDRVASAVTILQRETDPLLSSIAAAV